MEVAFKRAFLRDLKKLPADYRARVEAFAFEAVPDAEDLTTLQCVKIAGYENYFRKRIGPYRIGFKLAGGVATFYRVLHRRDIYRYFPQ